MVQLHYAPATQQPLATLLVEVALQPRHQPHTRLSQHLQPSDTMLVGCSFQIYKYTVCV